MESPNSQARPPAQPQALSGLWGRLPTGLPGAAFWLGVWFCILFLARRIPGGFVAAALAAGAEAHAVEPA